jgi:prepilin-type N-terminal cleavage/methylation domain-containing protein
MKKIMKNNNKSGFTIIELMFAIVVLGGMLSLTMVVIVGMLRFYVFANSVRQNQANGRETLDLIGRDVRFGRLISPTGTAEASEICVFTESDRKIVQFKLGSDPESPYDLTKKVYKWNLLTNPTDCVLSEDNSTLENTTKLNLNRMRIVKFGVTKTQGASFEVNDKAAAIIINYEFLTGNANSSGTACDSNNIYCSKLGYDTVINLRAGD